MSNQGTPSHSRLSSGFTLIEVAVSAAIVALLAAVTAPYLVGYVDQQKAQTTADQLAALATGIAAFGNAVKTTAAATSTTYPGFISELTSQIPSGSSVWHNSCTAGASGRFNSTATADWSNNGPFVSFLVPPGGLESPLGRIQDSLTRANPTATATTLAIRIVNVDTAAANLLDRIIDGGDGGAAGTLRVLNASGGTVEVQYLVPVGARC